MELSLQAAVSAEALMVTAAAVVVVVVVVVVGEEHFSAAVVYAQASETPNLRWAYHYHCCCFQAWSSRA